jgi:large subunit ribosomal protein L23
MTSKYEILRRPLITEKTNELAFKLNQYVFEVSGDSNRTMVKEAVESIFKVNVIRVNIITAPGKSKRNAKSRRTILKKPVIKKAIVTLAEGDKIPFFEGVE